SAQAFSQQITGLSPNTTYYFCAIASNAAGTGFGAVLSFTTPTAPTATTNAATLVTATTATLNGSGTPNLDTTYTHFRYSTVTPGACNDTFGTRVPASSTFDVNIGNGSMPVTFSQSISGLLPATTYYFCAIDYNNYGTA